MKSKPTSIYLLRDPRDHSVRYVGKTIFQLPLRLRSHVTYAAAGKRDTYCARWIRALLRINIQPIIELIETCGEDWANRERFWIAYYRGQSGSRLTNNADGGEGPHGVTHSAKTRAKFSERAKLQWADAEYRKKQMALVPGRYTPEVRAKHSANTKALWLDPAFRVPNAERLRNQMADPAMRDRLSAKAAAQWTDAQLLEWRSARSKEMWASQRLRDQILTKRILTLSDPKIREQMSDNARDLWADPGYRAKQEVKAKSRWTDEVRAAHSAATKLRMETQWTPERRAALSLKMKAVRAQIKRSKADQNDCLGGSTIPECASGPMAGVHCGASGDDPEAGAD
jgi:hypothetical protein